MRTQEAHENAVLDKARGLGEQMRGGAGGSGPGDAVAVGAPGVEVPDLAAGEYLVTEILEHRVGKGGRTRYGVAWGEHEGCGFLGIAAAGRGCSLAVGVFAEAGAEGSARQPCPTTSPPRFLAEFASEPDVSVERMPESRDATIQRAGSKVPTEDSCIVVHAHGDVAAVLRCRMRVSSHVTILLRKTRQ